MYMYVNICICMYMYMLCTYRSQLVHNFIYMYIHVCTMHRALYTDLQILVHVVRIPDVLLAVQITIELVVFLGILVRIETSCMARDRNLKKRRPAPGPARAAFKFFNAAVGPGLTR